MNRLKAGAIVRRADLFKLVANITGSPVPIVNSEEGPLGDQVEPGVIREES